MRPQIELLGFSGYARSGKDTAYSLIADQGWQRVAFAEPMREFLYRLNPIVGKKKEFGALGPRDVRLKEVIDELSWDGYKSSERFGMEIRQLMQRLGTECGRELLGDNIWVNTALDNLESGRYAVTDCRFVNEADAIRERGGKIIRIERVGVGPANAHPSETSLDDYDFDAVVINDGSLEDLRLELGKLF